jgi:hypothetical protein
VSLSSGVQTNPADRVREADRNRNLTPMRKVCPLERINEALVGRALEGCSARPAPRLRCGRAPRPRVLWSQVVWGGKLFPIEVELQALFVGAGVCYRAPRLDGGR